VNALFGPAFEQLLDEIDRASDEAASRAWKAMALSGGDIDVCCALLRGESVPVDRLDQEQLARYGLKQGDDR
jgi:hypothetical protein